MADNPIRWFEIYVQDIERAKKFYSDVLGVEFTPLTPPDGELQMWGFPSNGEAHGSSGSLVQVAGVDSGNNSTLVYFASEDCAQEQQRIEGAGGEVIRGKYAIGDYGFCVLAYDTEGNRFGIHSMA